MNLKIPQEHISKPLRMKMNTINGINNTLTPKIFNKYKGNLFNKKKARKKILKLDKDLDVFSFDEEYVSKLKYYNPKLNSDFNTNSNKIIETLYNINASTHMPTVFKKYQIIDNKQFEENKRKLMSKINVKKQVFEKNVYNDMEHTRYVGRLENMFRENTLEKNRHELEEKMSKIKELLNNLSQELAETLNKIDNAKIDLKIFNNYKTFSLIDVNIKKYLRKETTGNLSDTSEDNSYEKIKRSKMDSKAKAEMIKNLKKLDIEEKKRKTLEKLKILCNKKKNILDKINSCERDLNEFKEKYNVIKNELLVHYHKLLLEGKDTRRDGLSWIIKSIWNLKSNVIMSFLPKFLDVKSISFLFMYSDKLVEIEKIQKKMENIKNEIKKREKKSRKLSQLSAMILEKKSTMRLNYLKDINEIIQKRKEDEEELKKVNNITNKDVLKLLSSKSNYDISSIPQSPNNTAEDAKRFKAMKRLMSVPELNLNIIKMKEIKENMNKNNFDDTFKTSLYKTNSKLATKKKDDSDSYESKSNERKKQLKINILDPKYREKFQSHLSPQKTIKVRDYENFQNFKVEESFDQELLNLFSTHQKLLKNLKKMKNEAEIFLRKELDRVGKCFYLEDYEGKFNTELKVVIGALIGEDNVRNELFRQEKAKRDYFKIIKSLRSFNAIYYKNFE